MGHPKENYEAPEHPSGETQPSNGMENQKSHIGKTLFDSAFNFYAWYLAHDNTPTKHSYIFELLSELMQIAKISFENGLYLSAEEERTSTVALAELSEALSTGFCKCNEIPTTLENILKKLIDDNPRAMIISLLTKIEYKLCIHNDLGLPVELSNEIKELLRSVSLKIVPSLPDLIVNTLARDLDRIFSKVTEDKDFIPSLKEAVKILDY